MAQTVEELAQLLDEMKVSADSNAENIHKILANISNHIEVLSNGNETGDLLKVYFSELKKVLEERHALVISEFSNIEKSFNTIYENENEFAKTSELQAAFDSLTNSLQMGINEIYSQRSIFEDLNSKISVLANDKTDKTDIINSIGMLRKDVEIIDANFTKTASDIQANTQNIIKNLVVMDPASQNDVIKKELENIYMSTNSILSLLNDAEQHNENLINTLNNVVTKDEFENARESFEARLSDNSTRISGLLEVLGQKVDDIALATNDSKVLYEFENIKNILTEQKSLFEGSDQNEKIRTISDLLHTISEKIEGLQNHDLQNFNEKISQIVTYGFEQISDKINNLQNNDFVTDIKAVESNIIEKLDGLQSTEAIQNIQENIDTIKSALSSDFENQQKINDKLESFGSEIQNDINLLKESITTANDNSDLTEKLLALRDIISNKSDNTDKQISKLEDKINEFISAGEKISNDAEIKIGNSLSELSNLKEEISNIAKNFAEWNFNQSEQDAKLVGMISSEIDNLRESVTDLQDSVQTGMHQELSRNSEVIDTQMSTLTEKIDQLIKEFIERTTTPSGNDSELQDIKDKINAVKQEINLVNTDVIDAINSRTQAILVELSPLKAMFDEISPNSEDDSEETSDKKDEILDAISDLKDYVSEVCGGYGKTENGAEELKSIISAALNNDDMKWAIDDLKSNFATRIEDSTSKISELLDVLNEKVDILAMSDNSEINYDIEEIKNMISSQKDILEASSNNNTVEIESKLSELINKIDALETVGVSDISELKENVVEAILNVFEQISFIEESEDIKDFVEEKTDEINQNIIEVKEQLKQFVDGSDDEYSYTLQDVESDIAKLRLVINDLSNSSTNEEISDISNNIHRIVSTVEDMQSTLTQDQISGLKSDFEKLSEDVLSISSRTNKLILSSDESYNALSNGLNDFSNVISKLEERINYLDNKEITERIEEKLNNTYNVVTNSANSDKVMRQALMYMGEWIDTASENLQSLCENSETQNENSDEIKDALEEIKNALPEQKNLLNTITLHFEEQQDRMDRLEMKLEKILSAIDNIDDTKLVNKVDKVDKQVKKLSTTIEKLATYVDE